MKGEGLTGGLKYHPLRYHLHTASIRWCGSSISFRLRIGEAGEANRRETTSNTMGKRAWIVELRHDGGQCLRAGHKTHFRMMDP